MGVGTVNVSMERKLKNKLMYFPSDYLRYTEEARKFPFKTKRASHDQIKNYADQSLMVYDGIRPGKKPGESTVVDIKVIQYQPIGTSSFLTMIFFVSPQRRKLETTTSLSSFKRLHKSKIKYLTKWQLLQDFKFGIMNE